MKNYTTKSPRAGRKTRLTAVLALVLALAALVTGCSGSGDENA